ncbi:MAG TPA: S41 family peptidase [Candidatus Polarisedimenticolia bacterium]|nr:S41 family peptidase [Candidatus Polarisedimenticolia bacterium]
MAIAIAACHVWGPAAYPAEPTKFERDRARMMLNVIKKDLIKYYYDETFHGRNLEEIFQASMSRIDKAQTHTQLLTAVAMPVIELDDSHTTFIPPERSARFHFGWSMQPIGDQVFITAVQEGSDAEAKGVKRGDRVLTFNDGTISRETLWDLYYAHRVLVPSAKIPLLLQSPGEDPRRIEVAARVEEGKVIVDPLSPFDRGDFRRAMEEEAHIARNRLIELSEDVLIWRMPQFFLTDTDIRTAMNRIGKYGALILDLRDNPGGAVETLERLAASFVEPGTKVGDVKSRQPIPKIVARKTGDRYEGRVVVLVDSWSASCSEMFARTMQISGRAKVIGDRTMGAVMMSQTYDHRMAGLVFSTSITIADIIMPDGKSLEKVGVVPDVLLLPTAEDLAAGRDPVLAHAASLFGVSLDPEKAGSFFPVEWRR